MKSLLQIALLCFAPVPRDRPKMSIVHKMIEDIRIRIIKDGGVHSPLFWVQNITFPFSKLEMIAALVLLPYY